MDKKEEESWFQITHHLEKSIQEKFSQIQHHVNGESHFLFDILDRIVHKEPVLTQTTKRFVHQLHIGRVTLEKPLSFDTSTNCAKPLYPYTARMRDLNYVAKARVDLVYKLGRRDNPEDQVVINIGEILANIHRENESSTMSVDPSPSPNKSKILEDAAAFVASIGEIFVQVRGEMCRLRGSGVFCHEDPDDEGGYTIVGGIDKVTEGHFYQRGNYPYVHFQNSSTSQSQSTTATEANNVESSATADSPVILECDYRHLNCELQIYNSAFHIFLLVLNPRHARKVMERQMKTRTFDAECFLPSSSSSVSLQEIFASKNGARNNLFGLGEHATIGFPNVPQFNMNLVCVMFLLGLNTRREMIECVLPKESRWLRDAGLIDENDRAKIPSDEMLATNPHIRQAFLIYNQAYVIFYNQSIFPAAYSVDPNKVYYLQKPGNYAQTKGTYEYISRNHMPFVGHDDCSDDRNKSNGWKRGDNFVTSYAETKIDGWNRAAILAHISLLMTMLTTKKAGYEKDETGSPPSPTPSSINSKIVLPKSKELPDESKSKKLDASFQRFQKSFIEEFLHHLGTTSHWRTVSLKKSTLGHIIKKMILVYMGYLPPDSQDNLIMKRVKMVGNMMADVWRNAWTKGVNKLFRQAVTQIEKDGEHKKVNWHSLAATCFKQSPFKDAMTRGVWSNENSTVMDVSGFTKPLPNVNTVTCRESLRKVRVVMNKKGATRLKDSAAQQLDNTHENKLCPMHTGNDNKAGIDVYESKGEYVRVGYDTKEILLTLISGMTERRESRFYNHFIRYHDFDPEQMALATEVFINGTLVGYTLNPIETMRALKLARVEKFFPFDVSITWVGGLVNGFLLQPLFNFIHIGSDHGALLSPYIDLKNLHKLPSIVMEHTSAFGIFPNFTLAGLVKKYGHNPGSRNIPVTDQNLQTGQLFDRLLDEGVIVYCDTEEMTQEYKCKSFRDLMPHMQDYILASRRQSQKTPSHGWDLKSAVVNTLSVQPPQRHSRYQSARWTLLNISEDLMLGVAAGITPFINCNDPCRSSYSTGMTTQATGAAPLNHKWKKRVYNMSLLEPKKTLCPNTWTQSLSVIGAGHASIPSHVAFLSRTDNGEDAVLRAQSPWGKNHVQHTQIIKSTAKDAVVEEDMSKTSIVETSGVAGSGIEYYTFGKPDTLKCLTLKSTDYESLDEKTGIPTLGSSIQPGAAIVGRTFLAENGSAMRDGSKTNQSRMTLTVESIAKTPHKSNASNIYVRATSIRVQEVGDKDSSLHGQKGVNGAVISRAELPYTIDEYNRASIPEIYRGPHGYPSRTTSGEKREMLHAMSCLKEGRSKMVQMWGRDFCTFDQLERVWPGTCHRAMIHQETGLPLMTSVCVGVLDYRLMQHLSRETFNSRSLGAVDPRTEQPTQGTRRGGGVREGNLEAFNKLSQGASEVMEQLLFSGSDPGFAHICTCGLLADPCPPKLIKTNDILVDIPAAPTESDLRKSRLFAHNMMNAQGGEERVNLPNTVSLGEGAKPKPSGGWCSVCGRSDTVYMVKLPRVTQQLIENAYMCGLAWRLVLDVGGENFRLIGEVKKKILGDQVTDVEEGLDGYLRQRRLQNLRPVFKTGKIKVRTFARPPSPSYSYTDKELSAFSSNNMPFESVYAYNPEDPPLSPPRSPNYGPD